MIPPVSLLHRLRRPDAGQGWGRSAELYTPSSTIGRGAGLQEPDAADLTQDILTLLVRKPPEFRHDQDRTFRARLRAMSRTTSPTRPRAAPFTARPARSRRARRGGRKGNNPEPTEHRTGLLPW